MLEYNDENHTYFVDGIQYPNLTSIMKVEGITNFSFVNENVLQRSQEFGKALHKVLELYDKGTLDLGSVSIPLLPHLEQWKKFLSEHKVKIYQEWIETPIFSKLWHFACTPDRGVCEIDDIISVLEIKSTISLDDAIGLQLAGQQVCVEEYYNKVKIKQRVCIQLKADTYHLEYYNDKSDRSVILGAILTANWRLAHGKLSWEELK